VEGVVPVLNAVTGPQVADSAENGGAVSPIGGLVATPADSPDGVDLQVVEFDAPSAVNAGDTVTFSWTAVNAGDLTVAGPVQDNVYLSDDTTLSGNYTQLGSQFEYNVSVGQQYTQTLTAQIPYGIPAGPQYFVLQLATGQEGSDPAGMAATPVQLTVPDVDLSVTNLSAPATIKLSDSFTVEWNDQNGGTDDTTENYTDYVFLSDTPDLTGTAYYLGQTYNTDTVPAGGSAGRSLQVYVPGHFPPRTT
jgi:hypothetical protein